MAMKLSCHLGWMLLAVSVTFNAVHTQGSGNLHFVNLPAAPSQITLVIDEDIVIGTLVYTVQAFNDLTTNISAPPNTPILYRITRPTSSNPPNCPSGWFFIDQATGAITTMDSLSVTLISSVSCTITVQVDQSDSTPNTSSLIVTIRDVNQPHRITNLPATVMLDSTTAVGQAIFTVNVTDPDLSVSPAKTYNLFMLDSLCCIFSIDQTGNVRITGALDKWLNPLTFHLNISVTDGVFLAGPHTLTVNLQNVLTPPVLSNLPSTISILETTPITSVVYSVTSTNGTRGAPVSYSILRFIPTVGQSSFNISSSTGQVRTWSTFDYFKANQYILEIQATNNENLKSTPQNLTIIISHVNQQPSFTYPLYTSLTPENQNIADPLPDVLLGVTDRDTPAGDWYNYYTNDTMFVASNATNRLYTTRSLALIRGQKSVQYDVSVTVYDSRGQTDMTVVTITVYDINDHAPQFVKHFYNGSVQDDAAGQNVTGVILEVDDDDADLNAKLTFDIIDMEMKKYFEISETGNVILKQPISYADYPNVTFDVLVQDGGVPSLNDTATVFVVVVPSDSHSPVFNSSLYEVELRSDKPLSSVVTTVSVNDLDPAIVNNVTYKFVVPQTKFDIDKNSGEIIVRDHLAPFTKYLLYVQATDVSKQTVLFTDPVAVSVDTYKAADQLVDIRMAMTVSEVQARASSLVSQLSQLVQPWTVRLEAIKSDSIKSVVTIYAVKTSASPSPVTRSASVFAASQYTSQQKEFVHRNDLLAIMRTDLYGTPNDVLRSGDFAAYEVEEVNPTYANWALETPEGIATLTVSCVVAAGLIVVAIVLIARACKVCCFKPKKVHPSPVLPEPVGDVQEFQLDYDQTAMPATKPPVDNRMPPPSGLLPSKRASMSVTEPIVLQNSVSATKRHSMNVIPEEQADTVSLIGSAFTRPAPPSAQFS